MGCKTSLFQATFLCNVGLCTNRHNIVSLTCLFRNLIHDSKKSYQQKGSFSFASCSEEVYHILFPCHSFGWHVMLVCQGVGRLVSFITATSQMQSLVGILAVSEQDQICCFVYSLEVSDLRVLCMLRES
jgi:hypothetical protein